jgi:transposase
LFLSTYPVLFLLHSLQKRHQSDTELSARKATILTLQATFVDKKCRDIQVGDVVRCESDEFIYADMVIMSSSKPEGSCYSRLHEKLQTHFVKLLFCHTKLRDCWSHLPTTHRSSLTMPPHLTTEMRERIVVWHSELGISPSEIAELAGCSERTVYDVLGLYRDYGVVHNPFARPRGGRRSLDTGDMNYISSILPANPCLYLDEIQERLSADRRIDVSLSTISRAIRSLALSHKHVSKAAVERNELLRATWQAEYGDIPAEYFVWLDESSVDDHTNQRTHGRAPFGRACVSRATFIRGQRYSVLPALTSEGIIALDIFEGSVTKEKFIQFVREDLVRILLSHQISQSDIFILGPTPYSLPGTTKCCRPRQLCYTS